METPAGTTRQFGPFEVNLASGELLKQGQRVRLQDQPFRLLVILLENAGQVVTREQIQNRIWSGNIFVDFDSSLRVAVRKLRKALGDNAENPRYIETIPKRGYRFLAPALRSADPVNRVAEAEMTPEAAERRHWFGASTKPIFAAVILLLAALSTGAFLFLFRSTRVLTDKDEIVLADFVNKTDDPVFDGTLRQGMAVELEQSPFLSLVSEDRVQQVLRLMGQPANARLTPEVARDICERTGSAAVLDGSIASLGTQYVLGLRARDCRTGSVLAQEQVQAARKEDVLNALSQIASKFRTRVGESLTTVEKHNTPLAEATTPSLEALKTYSAGWKVLSLTGSAAAIPYFTRAIEIDPEFAMAYASLGRMYADIGEFVLSAENTGKAYELRERASDNEKFFISASYDMQVTGNLTKAQQTCELWEQVYPRAAMPHMFLAGIILPTFGKYELSVEEAKIAISLDPDFAVEYQILAYNNIACGRLVEAESALRTASARKLEIPDFLILRYTIAFLKGDQAGMEREADQARGRRGVEDWMIDSESLELAYSGHLKEARKMSSQAGELAQHANRRGTAALYVTDMALREAFLGNRTAARRRGEEALALSKSRDVQFGAAFALALSGDYAQSQTLLHDLAARFSEDTIVKFNYLPTLRALLALKHNEPANAIELLQVAMPYELGTPATFPLDPVLYPVYVRGQAYLATHQGAEAAAEFQKILDHRGIVLSNPIGALARCQLGRALAMSGDKTRANTAYQDFFVLWKDADPDIPILQQAKAEYANLQ